MLLIWTENLYLPYSRKTKKNTEKTQENGLAKVYQKT